MLTTKTSSYGRVVVFFLYFIARVDGAMFGSALSASFARLLAPSLLCLAMGVVMVVALISR